MDSILVVPSKLTFSENLRCLDLALLVGAVSQKRLLPSTYCRKEYHFKHLKYSENVNFEGTNSVDSILVCKKHFASGRAF